MKLPESVKVGPHTVSISQLQAEHEFFGDFNKTSGTIRVLTEGVEHSMVADTLLHEILHAVYYYYNITDEDEEERTVTAMSTALIQVFADNPKVAKFITETK